MGRFTAWLFEKTLNSVVFGICLMVLTAGYIAIGSGLPRVREAFEMNELQFFSAWPLKILMWLLVLNLATVTVMRIPFTRPRYGVWCIHAGIITLIFGMSYYYSRKIEGLCIIPKGATADWFYDSGERSLYVGIGGVPAMMHPVPSLPRFKSHPIGDEGFAKSDLQDIVAYIEHPSKDGKIEHKTLKDFLGLKDDVRFDVVGYWPYATIESKYEESPTGAPGVKLTVTDPHSGTPSDEYLALDSQGHNTSIFADTEFELRAVSNAESGATVESAARFHRIDVQLPEFNQSIYVEPGKSYPLGTTGYTIAVENFNPDFPAMNGEHVKLITLMVTTPKTTFRRQLIPGRANPTDWLLNAPGAGPLGKRQTEPLDAALKTAYEFSDPRSILPAQASARKTLLLEESGAIKVISTSKEAASTVQDLADGTGSLTIGDSDHPLQVAIKKVAGLKRTEAVREVPPAKRDRQAGESGLFQVTAVKVMSGDFSQIVYVPFAEWAREPFRGWDGGVVRIPGANIDVQLQLGNTRLPLPARITLVNFELEKYMGANENTRLMRDFKSTLKIEDRETGGTSTDIAKMNHPAYWGGIGNSMWTFFQASWDPNGQRFTVLGIGNRPGVWIQIAGSVMIVVGLLYAFYLKPIIIRQMKQKALAEAAARAPVKKPKGQLVQV